MIKKVFLLFALIFSANLLANDAKHYEAALAVISIPQGEKLEEMVQGVVEQQINANYSIKPVRKAYETFYREIFQSEEFIHGLADIQMTLFSYEELLEIKKMMALPIYAKYEELMPSFITKNMQLAQQIIMANEARFEALLEAEHKRIEELQLLDEQMNLTGTE